MPRIVTQICEPVPIFGTIREDSGQGRNATIVNDTRRLMSPDEI
jgi:hypothetical protein